eukprot:356407-Chlamydomonas_euryale.AAC.2
MLEDARGLVPMAPPTHVPGEEVATVDGTFVSVACATLGTASHGARHALWMTPAALAVGHARRGAHAIWAVLWSRYGRARAQGAVLTALESASDGTHAAFVQYCAATFVSRAVCWAAKAAHQKQQDTDLDDALRGPGRAQREAHQQVKLLCHMHQHRVRVLVRGSGGALHAGQDAADVLADEPDRQDSALPNHDPRRVQAAEAEAEADGVVGRPPDPLPPPTLPAAAPRPVMRSRTAAPAQAPTTSVHPAMAAEPATAEPGVLEVADRIADLNNTAPGASGIVALALKRAGVAAARLMARPIQAAWRSGVVPPQWRRALGNPVAKAGDPYDPANFRKLTLIDVGAKLYVLVILHRIRPWLEPQRVDEQHGFCTGRGPGDAQFVLQRLAELAAQHGQHVYTLFVDYRRAFDCVHQGALWAALRAYSVPGKLVDLLAAHGQRHHCCGGRLPLPPSQRPRGGAAGLPSVAAAVRRVY